MTESSRGRFYFWGQSALYVGPGLTATVHAHYAAQICIPLSGRVRLRAGPSVRWQEYETAVIGPNEPHESDAAVGLIATLWFEPNMVPSHNLLSMRSGSPITSIARGQLGTMLDGLLACWGERWDSPHAAALAADILRTVTAKVFVRRTLHPRVKRALEILASAPERRVPLVDLAAGVSLSPSRIAHLLKAELRVPARRYLLWLRLRDAVQALGRGESITAAAHTAGFADAPHFDRTFRRMLGFTPSAALQVSKFVQDE